MGKIFKQLARHWAACLVVFALLAVQAYCDLSLPAYTSNIVDVGIQQGGIESAVPQTVRQATLEALESLMPASDASLVEQWYSEPDETGVRTLARDAKAAMPELERAFTTPDVVLYMASARYAAQAQGTDQTVTPTAADLDALCARWDALTGYLQPEEMQQQMEAFGASMGDSMASQAILTGIMPVRAFSREQFEEERFDVANRDLMRTQLFTNRTMAGMMPFMTLIMNGTSLLIVWFGGKAMDAGTMQVGEMIAFITYTMQIVMSFLMLAMVAIMLPRAGVAAQRIDEVLRTSASVRDPAPALAEKALQRKSWSGVVRFDNVRFRYPGAESDALENISFTALPGQTTAIIGSTGCGKSTLLNLIPRFYDVTGGSVSIDGVDVRDMPQNTLHDLLGYVPQKGVLFSGTIESNLKFGGPQITEEAMHQAAAIAQATDFIEAKPESYQSPIAQGGSNVSGGQKQRLSIARAVAKQPRIYLFDDSFSALDYKTDVALRRALKAQTGDATVIIVAQRISTVLHANRILVLDEGRLVGMGTHAQLLESCPEYREIARSQLSQKELGLQKEED